MILDIYLEKFVGDYGFDGFYIYALFEGEEETREVGQATYRDFEDCGWIDCEFMNRKFTFDTIEEMVAMLEREVQIHGGAVYFE